MRILRSHGLAVVFLLCFPVAVSAQPTAAQLTQAREVFRSGIALETASDWRGALTKFREVAAVKSSPQVRFHIAVCQEKLGKWTEALGTYQVARNEAETAGAKEVVAAAEKHQHNLAAVIPRLTIVRGEGAKAAVISLDGVSLGETSVNVELRVDPGPHTVEAYDVSKSRVFSEIVTLAANEATSVTVKVADAAPAIKPALVAVPATEKTTSAPLAQSSRTPGYVLLGVGAAAAVSTGVFWALRGGTISDLDAQCVNNRCPAETQRTADRGRLYSGIALGSALVAVGALGSGLYLTLSSGNRTTAERQSVLRVRPAGLGAIMEKTF